MSGGNMLHELNSADQNQNNMIDAHELVDVLNNLKPGELHRGLKNKSEDITKVVGIGDAVNDLIAQHTDGAIDLNQNQINGLYALRDAIVNGPVNIKKMGATIVDNIENTQNELWQSNIESYLSDTNLTFVGWLMSGGQENKGNAVITNSSINERYHIEFNADGSLKTQSGSVVIEEIYDVNGVLQKDAKPKIAYVDTNQKLIIEDKENFDKREKTREFAEKLNEVNVPGTFVMHQQENGSMELAYFSDAVLSETVSPLFVEGNTDIDVSIYQMYLSYTSAIADAETAKKDAQTVFDTKKAEIEANTHLTTQVDRDAQIASLQSDLDKSIKEQDAIIAENNENILDLYRSYALSHPLQLINLSPECFTLNTDLSLVDASGETIDVSVVGKNATEQLSNYITLDEGNVLLTTDVSSNASAWNVYTKKEGTTTYISNDSPSVVVDNEVPVPDVVPANEVIEISKDDLDKQVDALTVDFMFSNGRGEILDKSLFLTAEKQALKKLNEDPDKRKILQTILDAFGNASTAINKSTSQRESIKLAQSSLGDTSPDGYRGPVSHDRLLDFAGLSTLKKPNIPVKIDNPSPTPVSVPKQKPSPSVDVFAEKKGQLNELKESVTKKINPLLKLLVPSAASIDDYKENLPKNYTDGLVLIDSINRSDDSTTQSPGFSDWYSLSKADLVAFEKSLSSLKKRTVGDYAAIVKSNKYEIDGVLSKITGYNNAKLGNEWSNDLLKGYIKFSDPTTGYSRSYFAAAFLKQPTYRKGERKLAIDHDVLETLVENRLSQKDYPNGPTPNIASSMFS